MAFTSMNRFLFLFLLFLFLYIRRVWARVLEDCNFDAKFLLHIVADCNQGPGLFSITCETFKGRESRTNAPKWLVEQCIDKRNRTVTYELQEQLLTIPGRYQMAMYSDP